MKHDVRLRPEQKRRAALDRAKKLRDFTAPTRRAARPTREELEARVEALEGAVAALAQELLND